MNITDDDRALLHERFAELQTAIETMLRANECMKAIDAIGGDPATVQELVEALRDVLPMAFAYIADRGTGTERGLMRSAAAVLAKIPEAP